MRTSLLFVMSLFAVQAAEPKPALTLTTSGNVKWIAFAPDGKTLLTSNEISRNGEGHELRLWDAVTGKLIAGPVKTDHASASGAISPDGKTAVTGSFEASWQIWSLPDLTPGKQGQFTMGRIHRVAFAPGGDSFSLLRANYRKWLIDPIKGSRVTYSAYTFNAKTGDRIGPALPWPRELRKDEPATAPRISEPAGWSRGMAPAFAKDGQPVPPTAEDTLALLVPDDTENCGGPAAGAISPDRKLAASSGCNGEVVIFDRKTRQPLGEPLTLLGGLQVFDNALLFTPKSDRLAMVRLVQRSNPEYYRPVVLVYDVTTREQVGKPILPGHISLLNAIAFSPDGATFAAAFQVPGDTPAYEIQLWKYDAGK